MAVPVQLEIFMKDLTKAGLQSVGKNVDDVENQTLQLIEVLKQVRAEQIKQLEANKQAGKSYTQEAANVQALTGQVRGLEAGLKELKKTKEDTAKTQPIDIDTEAVTRKTNNLKMQFSQVARELPSLAMGPQMFILAISNNLPMLADAISDVRKQNELLKASGQKGVPVWKQLAGAVFSWQTALVAAISIGIVYGKEIGNWVKSLGKVKKELIDTQKIQDDLNKVQVEGGKAAAEETTKLRLLYTASQDTSKSMKERNKVVDELQKMYPSYFGKLSNEEILAGKASDAYDRLTKSIISSAKARAAMNKMVEEQGKILENEQKINDAYSRLDPLLPKMEAAKKKLNIAKTSASLNTGKLSTSGTRNLSVGGNVAVQQAQSDYDQLKKETDAIYEEIAGYRAAIYTSNKLSKELEGSIQVDDLLTREKGSTGSGKTDYASQLADARVKAQQTTEKLRLQIMLEGIAKRKALAKQEYDDSIADIDKQERDTLAKMDKARKQGDNIPQSQYDSVKQEAQTQRILAQQVLNKKLLDIDNEYQNKAIEAQITYNKQYGTYAEQRAAIIAEGLRKAAKAENDGSRKLILRQTEDALKQLDFKRFKDSINFADVFSNLDTQTTGALKILRDKLKEYINNAAGELGPEDLKELQDAFQKIDFKIAERDPFGELKTGLKEYKSAQESVNKAQKDLDTVMQGGAVITGMYMDENGKLISRLLSVEQAEKNLSEAQSNRQQVLTKLTAAANYIGTQGLQVVNAGSQIVDMLESFGVKMPEAVSNTLNGLGQVMSGLESIDLTKPFSAITGSLDILTGIGNTISGLLGFGGADYSGYEEMKSRYEGLIDIWDTLIDKKTEYIDIDYGTEAQKAAEEAIKLTETQIERQRQLIKQLADSGKSAGSHSLGVRIYDRLNSQDWERISNLVGEKITHEYQLWDLLPEQIEKLLSDEKLISVLDTVNSDFVEYLQNIVEYGEQLEEIASKEQEAITGIGFDAFRDGYIDLISDLESTNEDLADNLEKNLQNAFFRSLIANKYNSQIKALYDNWVKLGEDGLTRDEVDSLREQNQAMVDQMIKDREELMNTFGWSSTDSSGSSQSPSSGVLTTMSQDSISTFEGIGRNMQTHLANIDKFVQDLRESQKLDSETLATIASHTAYIVLIYDLMEDMKLNGIKMQ